MISIELVNILACPVCKGDLQSDNNFLYLSCRPCGLKFQNKDSIPVMLAEDAEKFGDQEPRTGDQ